MKINVFKGQNKEELSMIEVAHALLEQENKEMYFNDLVNVIQEYLGKTDTEIKATLSRFYTDLNIDGSFISLGENKWGLRSWYAINEIDEEVTHLEEDDDEEITKKRKKRNGKINAFINSPDDDVIDYNDDDPEDDDEFHDEEDEDITDKDVDDDEDEEIVAYDSDLKEIVVDADDEEVLLDEEDEDALDEDIEN
ncbi:MAG: DNA-directed RNA polymerase subunit delta [Streptococcaceae bacterium]|nr:DNA-directed RNA polymerase subunit delta [Streptococcaceae bacterium]